MLAIDSKVKLRLNWIKLYQQLGHVGAVCSHYSISPTTLRKWNKRYKLLGEDGLKTASSKPKNFPLQKRNQANESLILSLRKERKLGARRIQNELKRLYSISFSLATIHKVLSKYNVAPLSPKRHYRKQVKRYSSKVPGERLQMDVCKIRRSLYQYTLIDDCTRYKKLALYNKRTAANTINFLTKSLAELPFTVQRIQTDRGQEFFAYAVQEYLMGQKIKFRPIRPLSPHLNGKVERSQRTDLDEFYNIIDLDDPNLADKLKGWEMYYNYQRVHGSLHGKTPYEQYKEQAFLVPSLEEIQSSYDASKEAFHVQNYKYDQELKSIIAMKTNKPITKDSFSS